MPNTLTRAVTPAAIFTVLVIAGNAAFAQAPSQAQRDAIKAQCRNDYIAHCSSIPPGGAASLQCLQKNMASLAPGCASAVSAVDAPAEPKADAAPKPDATPASGKTKQAAPTGAPAPKTATAPATAPAAAPAAPPPAIVLRPMRPREELFVIRSACGADVRTICGDVQPGGGRIIRCLATNAASLSPACRDVLAPFAAQ